MRKIVSLGITGLSLVLLFQLGAVAGTLKVGDKAPKFKATTVDGKTITLANLKGAKAAVVCFTCNNCPVAKAYEDRFIAFCKEYADKGVKFVAINVNKGENLEKMKQRADEKGFNFPYAYDATEKSARAYGARVTPHLFVLDSKGAVAFIGSFDDNIKAQAATKHFVVDAVDALLAGRTPETTESKAFGCGIKFRKK